MYLLLFAIDQFHYFGDVRLHKSYLVLPGPITRLKEYTNMARQRRGSNVSSNSSLAVNDQVFLPHRYSKPLLTTGAAYQELGSMYDYLAKVILLGPSGSGKFVHALSSSANPRAYLAPGPASYTESSRTNVCRFSVLCMFSSGSSYRLTGQRASTIQPDDRR